jgi:membrane fusion protein (multidrug efflux system)
MANQQQDRDPAAYGQRGGNSQPSGEGTERRPARSKRSRTNPVLLVLTLILILGGGIGGVIYWLHARQYVETNDAFIDGDIVQVGAKVAGEVQSVEVEDNQDVAAGTVLVRIDPKDFQVNLNETKAALEAAAARLEAARTQVDLVRAHTDAALTEAQAAVEQAKAAVQSSKDQLASSQADVVAAEADATRRQADLKRYRSLDQRAVSQQQLDLAQAAADSAQANLAAARKRASAAESAVVEAQAKQAYAEGLLAAAKTGPQQVAAAAAQAKNAQAAVDQAKAAVDQAELNLSYTTIRAPVAGRVTRRTARPGQYLQVGQTVMALVQPNVWVTANFKENQITHMNPGQNVDIRVDAYPGQVFHGKVDSIQAGSGARFSMLPPENATGNYIKVVQRVPVKIVLDAEASRRCLLAPGMSVVPRVYVGLSHRRYPRPIAPPPVPAGTTEPAAPSSSP